MKIERVISWFDKKPEELKGEYIIDQISLDVLKDVFKPIEDDPSMYNPYTINAQEASALKELIDFEFDFEHFFIR